MKLSFCLEQTLGHGSVAALTIALKRLIDDDELRLTMGQNGRETAARDMNAEKNARRLVGPLNGAD